MEIRSDYKIENFAERLEWMIHYLEEAEGIKPIANRTELRNAMLSLEGASEAGLRSIATWNRYQKRGWVNRMPRSILEAVQKVYPSMSWDALTSSSIVEFYAAVADLQAAYDPWDTATKAVAKNREQLSWAAKKYYVEVDAAPIDFPLVAGPGWLPETPLTMTENDEIPGWNGSIPDVEGTPLWSNGVEYLGIKKKSIQKTVTNGPTFRLLNFAVKEGKPSFTFGRGRYFNYINTLEVLAAEFAKNPTDLSPSEHPRRGAPSDIFEFGGRSAFPGVNTLLIVKNFQGHKDMPTMDRFALHTRGQTTTEAQNTVHVVPAGGHQPLGPEWEGHKNDIEMTIWRTAVREFIEELFNKEEAHEKKHSGIGFFEDDEVKDYYRNFFTKPGASSVYYLGMGLDPLTTKPEILVAMVINWKVVSEGNDKLNSKYFQEIVDENYEGEVRFHPLSRDRLIEEATRHRNTGSILPAGAACLLQAGRPEFYDRIVSMK